MVDKGVVVKSVISLHNRLMNKLIILILFSLGLSAEQIAIVKSNRAVIYGDKELTAPLGFVSSGKELVVSDHPTGKGQLYKLLVSGKMAYIQIKDIDLKNLIPTSDQKLKQTRKALFK